MKKSSIIWGALFILIGVLILLRSFDIIYFSWWSFWRLWPVVLILIGVSVIPMKNWIKITLTILLIIGSMALIVRPNDGQHESFCSIYLNDLNFDDEDWDDLKDELKSELKNINESNYVALFDDSVTSVNLDLELTECDALSLKEYKKNGLLFSTVGFATYNLTTNTTENVANCSLVPEDQEHEITKADLLLSPNYSYTLTINTKSEYNNMDFSSISISDLNMTATDDNALWKLKFGENSTLTTVNLTTNNEVGKIEVEIPNNLGISVMANDLPDKNTWNGLKKSGDKFVSDNFDKAAHKIEIKLDQLDDVNFSIKEY